MEHLLRTATNGMEGKLSYCYMDECEVTQKSKVLRYRGWPRTRDGCAGCASHGKSVDAMEKEPCIHTRSTWSGSYGTNSIFDCFPHSYAVQYEVCNVSCFRKSAKFFLCLDECNYF